MSSREKILAQAKANKPALKDLPNVPTFGDGDNFVEQFKTILTTIGGKVAEMDLSEIADFVKKNFPNNIKIASNLIAGNVAIDANTSKSELAQIDLAVLNGEFGVAENGAIWLPESNMLNRALPFISQHLILVIPKKSVLPNMHFAYKTMSSVGAYGVFIAGPSKTADIEQSLVIGAHGARSMVAILV